MDNRQWASRAAALLLGGLMACTAPEEDAEVSDTEPSPSMVDACRSACADFVAEECNAANDLTVCEASCEQSDAELVDAFTECVDEDACGDCVQVWCTNGCA